MKHGGLGILTAAIFLAGEMAGSGVLALPAAMIGTGKKKQNKNINKNKTHIFRIKTFLFYYYIGNMLSNSQYIYYIILQIYNSEVVFN